MKSKSDCYYVTSYLLLATALNCDYPLETIDKSNSNTVKFIFKHSSQLDKTVELFWKRELRYEPVSFEDTRKSLLRRINEG